MSTLKELAAAVIAFRDARDWKQFHRPKDLALDLMIEAAEVGEHFLWKAPEEMPGHLAARRTAIGEELADVIHAALLLAHECGIDLEQAFADKMRKNEAKYPADKVRGSSRKYSEY